MRICSHCILPETFPGITFNSKGICQHCQKSNGKAAKIAEGKNRYGKEFFDLLLRQLDQGGGHAGRSYDILMAYSGGKDSTYTMGLLRNKYKLRVLALSFDNGFLSETSVTNIKKATDALGIDHIFFKPKWELLKKMFKTATERELFPPKTLERASTVCTSCMGIVKAQCLKFAIDLGIPMIGYGWSPGQAPVQSSIMRNNPPFVKMAQQAILTPLREVLGDEINAYFLQDRHYKAPEKFPYNVHPMAWEYYNENMILEEIGKIGWVAPKDTDSNSTNCLLNAFANDDHIRKYQFNPYVWEISNMIRDGVMTRKEGYEKIYAEQPADLIEKAKEKLGI